MLKKCFNALTLFAFLSVVCFIMVLFYNQSRALPFFIKHYHVVNGSNNVTWMIRERVQRLWTLENNDTNPSQKKIQTPAATHKSLERCPDKPPRLVGPLLVEFNSKRTLDDVRREHNTSLQMGGRLKPPDCIAQQKVGEWMLEPVNLKWQLTDFAEFCRVFFFLMQKDLYITFSFILFHFILRIF